ncbi:MULTISPECIES: hypothetical protein [unclassified Pseudoalteromonas]|uniref:hypothetical protein n=1 Tax=unclassified Pseudoalteromonas TaxID=194690 RepID=UPI003864453B
MDKFFSIAIIIATFVAAFVFGYRSQPTEMGLIMVCGFILLCFTSLDKFKNFKGAGFSVELRETIDEATVTKQELEKLNSELEIKLEEIERKLKKTNTLALAGL